VNGIGRVGRVRRFRSVPGEDDDSVNDGLKRLLSNRAGNTHPRGHKRFRGCFEDVRHLKSACVRGGRRRWACREDKNRQQTRGSSK
jgi:hypothetical protein